MVSRTKLDFQYGAAAIFSVEAHCALFSQTVKPFCIRWSSMMIGQLLHKLELILDLQDGGVRHHGPYLSATADYSCVINFRFKFDVDQFIVSKVIGILKVTIFSGAKKSPFRCDDHKTRVFVCEL